MHQCVWSREEIIRSEKLLYAGIFILVAYWQALVLLSETIQFLETYKYEYVYKGCKCGHPYKRTFTFLFKIFGILWKILEKSGK